jgi:hypothetical protein
MNPRNRRIALFLLTVVLGVISAARLDRAARAEDPAQAPRLRVLVPAYFYPSGRGLAEWDKMIETPGRSAIVVIVNPASGPGQRIDPNYVTVVDRARKAGLTLIGYITVSYGKRPLDDVKADVDRWIQFYPGIQGIFFDEQASGPAQVGGQAALYDYVRKTKKLDLVVTNPGTICDEAYLSRPAADSVCLFEGPKEAGAPKLPEWTARYAPREITTLTYEVETVDAMRTCIARAVKSGVGMLYVTDASGLMPWGGLPHYWLDEMAFVRQVNNPSTR